MVNINWKSIIGNTKVVAFGEFHGITNLLEIKLSLLDCWIKQNKSIVILLEKPYDEEKDIQQWMTQNRPNNKYLDNFKNPKTSAFLEDQFRLLQKISDRFNKQITIKCIDISFSPKDNNEKGQKSKEILKIKDEDEFDKQREEFIINQLKENKGLLDKTDRILLIAGNMHTSKTPYYFSRDNKAEKHIATSAMWLNEKYTCLSIFSLPILGESNYQKKGKLTITKFNNPQSDIFRNLNFEKNIIKSSETTIDSKFKSSYDWIILLKDCTPSLKI